MNNDDIDMSYDFKDMTPVDDLYFRIEHQLMDFYDFYLSMDIEPSVNIDGEKYVMCGRWEIECYFCDYYPDEFDEMLCDNGYYMITESKFEKIIKKYYCIYVYGFDPDECDDDYEEFTKEMQYQLSIGK